jgi:hypothetical protein
MSIDFGHPPDYCAAALFRKWLNSPEPLPQSKLAQSSQTHYKTLDPFCRIKVLHLDGQATNTPLVEISLEENGSLQNDKL